MENPFHYGEIVTGDNFADREEELSSLVADLQGSVRLFLVSPRRYGKSSLLASTIIKLRRQGCLSAYIDLYKAPSLRSFAELYVSTLTAAAHSRFEDIARLLRQLAPALRPKLSVSSEQGGASVSFDVAFDGQEMQKKLRDIYDLPQQIALRKKKKLVVIIDEFQEIGNLGGAGMEKELRAAIQTHTHVNYVFAGSKQDVLLDMVRAKTRPFYQMGRIMVLGKIPRERFAGFLLRKFHASHYTVSTGTIDHVLETVEDFPHNGQFMCHEIWEMKRTSRRVDRSDVGAALTKILNNNSPLYLSLWDTLSLLQRRVLTALAREGAGGVYSKDTIARYDLGTPASTQTAVRGLQKKGILDRPNGAFFFSDVFFKQWIIRNIQV